MGKDQVDPATTFVLKVLVHTVTGVSRITKGVQDIHPTKVADSTARGGRLADVHIEVLH